MKKIVFLVFENVLFNFFPNNKNTLIQARSYVAQIYYCLFSEIECRDGYCLNGGTCQQLATGGIHCKCTNAFIGPKCETSK